MVTANERGFAQITLRFSGYIEKLLVAETGQRVRTGQALATVYSPEVLQAQQELITMRDWPTQDRLQPPTAAARKKLELLGVGKRGHHRPAELSGGEQQRVAIARAAANNPRVILADEPTGNLDPATSDRVFEALAALIKNEGAAALIATHNHDLARRADRIVTIRNGLIEAITL